MNHLWLIKIGEISLKKGNRAFFEKKLKDNIQKKLQSLSHGDSIGTITIRAGRYYLETEIDDVRVNKALINTPGIVSFSKAIRVPKELRALADASIDVARQCLEDQGGSRFKFEVRRIDKSLSMDSYAYARELGAILLDEIPQLKVDVKNPDFIIKVELREWGYVYQRQVPGPGGLPVGTGGRGILLLSGGIDSPVAGYLMAKRGIALTAVHFQTPPFTSPEAHDKVIRLAGALAPWCGGITLVSIPFTQCQIKINQTVDPSAVTLHSRACMMQIAESLAQRSHCGALITGESLGQVASQTMESLGYTDGATALPVFRPLIGMDKEAIITLSRKIGTYETAIEPYDDCCTLFSPDKPLTRPNIAKENQVYRSIDGLEDLQKTALAHGESLKFDSTGRPLD